MMYLKRHNHSATAKTAPTMAERDAKREPRIAGISSVGSTVASGVLGTPPMGTCFAPVYFTEKKRAHTAVGFTSNQSPC
jgi:hypothetical protein